MFDTDGLLYWDTTAYWDKISVYNYGAGNGDGQLLYYSEKYGLSGPVASFRLIQIRDGFDDFDYLRIAEELAGREAVMMAVNKVTSGILDYTEDYRVMEAARDEIAELILDSQP